MKDIKQIKKQIFENSLILKTTKLSKNEKKELNVKNDFLKHEIMQILLKRGGVSV